MVGAVILLALVASAGPDAPVPEDRSSDPEVPAPFREPASYVIPAVEAGAALIGTNRVDDWALDGEWARISWGSVGTNLSSGLRLDNDDIFVNFLGHPFQGAVPFDAARSMGLSFWTASAYTVVADLVWEFVAEIQSPSTNDLIESGLGGIFWGESLHRITELFLTDRDMPWLIRVLATLVLNPAGATNYAAFGRPPRLPAAPPWHARLYGGGLVLDAASRQREQWLFGADVTYGFPSTPKSGCARPFDTFDVRADVGLGGTFTGDGSVRGLIAGCHLGERVPGTWGLFGVTDFATGPGFRLAGTSLGPGILAQWRAGEARLRGTAILAGTAIAASGTTAETDFVDPTGGIPPKDSLYSMGPGFEAIGDLELTLSDRVTFRGIGRSWWIASVTPVKGLERVDLASLGVTTWLPASQFAGAEVSLARRASAQGRDPPVGGWTARAIWGVRLGTEPGP